MKNKFLLLLFVFIFFISSNVCALEVEYKGRNTGLKTNEESLFGDIDRLYPGDKLEDVIEIRNSSSDEKEFFFKIEGINNTKKEVLEQLDLKIVTYIGDEKEVYNGKYSLDNLKQYISIGKLKGNTSGSIKVIITLPTSIDNDLALEKVGAKWIFYTEGSTQTDIDVFNPDTGDNIKTYIGTLIISSILIFLLLIIGIKNKKESGN